MPTWDRARRVTIAEEFGERLALAHPRFDVAAS
jgi:hypothetical protein